MKLDLAKICTAVGDALLANELSGKLGAAYRFSYAKGKSGLSFGRCQWDLSNNLAAANILRECGFTQTELSALEHRTIKDFTALNIKLLAAKEIIDKHDQREIAQIVHWVRDCCVDAGIEFADEEAFVHVCDYHNQYNLEAHGKCIRALAALDRPVTAQDVLTYKKSTQWGRERPGDVERRWDNIHHLYAVKGGKP